MAMSDEKIAEALWSCARTLEAAGFKPERTEVAGNRAFWCAVQAQEFLHEGRREKVMRWLGFAQGVIFALGLKSIEDLKAMNKPDEEEPAHRAHGKQ